MNLKKDFGKRLKEIRQQKNFTQFQLAELSGIDEKHLSYIERGGSFPKADLIEKFAQILNVDICDFFNFQHLKQKQELISEITNKLQNTDYKQLQYFYKIIMDF